MIFNKFPTSGWQPKRIWKKKWLFLCLSTWLGKILASDLTLFLNLLITLWTWKRFKKCNNSWIAALKMFFSARSASFGSWTAKLYPHLSKGLMQSYDETDKLQRIVVNKGVLAEVVRLGKPIHKRAGEIKVMY